VCLKNGTILSISDKTLVLLFDGMLKRKFFTETSPGKLLSKFLIKLLGFNAVVMDYDTLLDFLEHLKYPRIAVGPCLCKKHLHKEYEPMKVCITIRCGLAWAENNPEYEFVSIDEAKKKLAEWEKMGLVHEVVAFCNSEKFIVAICNCDKRVCIPIRSYSVWKEGIYPSPKVVEVI
jgi:hypothetical protein